MFYLFANGFLYLTCSVITSTAFCTGTEFPDEIVSITPASLTYYGIEGRRQNSQYEGYTGFEVVPHERNDKDLTVWYDAAEYSHPGRNH